MNMISQLGTKSLPQSKLVQFFEIDIHFFELNYSLTWNRCLCSCQANYVFDLNNHLFELNNHFFELNSQVFELETGKTIGCTAKKGKNTCPVPMRYYRS
jgi:hypothetical protein